MGGQYISRDFHSFLINRVIQHISIYMYRTQQNEIVEGMNQPYCTWFDLSSRQKSVWRVWGVLLLKWQHIFKIKLWCVLFRRNLQRISFGLNGPQSSSIYVFSDHSVCSKYQQRNSRSWAQNKANHVNRISTKGTSVQTLLSQWQVRCDKSRFFLQILKFRSRNPR